MINPIKIEQQYLFSSLGYQFTVTRYSSILRSNSTVLLFCPPLGKTQEEIKALLPIKLLVLLGYSICLFDPIGEGDAWGERDFAGIEAQSQIIQLQQWLEEQYSNIRIICKGMSAISVLAALEQHPHSHPIIAMEALFRPEDCWQIHPELRKCSEDFWMERDIYTSLEKNAEQISWFYSMPQGKREKIRWFRRFLSLLSTSS